MSETLVDDRVGRRDADPGWDLVVELSRAPEGLGDLTDEGLGRRLRELEWQLRAAEAALGAVLAEVERRGAHLDDGHRTPAGWAQGVVRWSPADARARVAVARLVSAEPSVAEALEGGRLGVAQVRLLARARTNPRCGDELTGEVLALLLAEAQRLPYDDFARLVQRWEQLADADGAHRNSERAHERRGVWVRTAGHTTWLRGQLGPAQGAVLVEALRAFEAAEFQHDLDQARVATGDADPPPRCLPRTAAQRRADALLAAVTNNADVGVTVNVVVDEQTYLDAVADVVAGDQREREVASRSGGGDRSDHIDPRWRRCETVDGAAVDPWDAVVASVVGHVRRVVLNAAGVVIDLGRRSRLFAGSSREAVWLAQRCCLWPGCRSPYADVDHARAWDHGGHTAQDNAALLCGHHHRWKHRHGYRVLRDADGQWQVQRPDGTTLTPV